MLVQDVDTDPRIVLKQEARTRGLHSFVILPLLGVIEKPLAQPATIEDDFNAHYGKAGGSAAVQPAE